MSKSLWRTTYNKFRRVLIKETLCDLNLLRHARDFEFLYVASTMACENIRVCSKVLYCHKGDSVKCGCGRRMRTADGQKKKKIIEKKLCEKQ